MVQEEVEIWEDIKGYEGCYQVSNLGRVKSLKRRLVLKNKILTPTKHYKNGYMSVMLSLEGKTERKLVHQLVCNSFLMDSYSSYNLTCNHKNGIKSDNRLNNLEIVNISENLKHAYSTGLKEASYHKGESHPRTKLKNKDIKVIRDRYKKGNITQKELAKNYNVSRSCISGIVSYKNWNHDF